MSSGWSTSAAAAGMDRLRASAPWLPPSTSTRRTVPRPANRRSGGGRAERAARTGFPVVRSHPFPRREKVSEKLSMIPVATRASKRFARPGIAFCSWMSRGRRSNHAATPPGADTNPPMPRTRAGRIRRSSAAAWTSATPGRREGSRAPRAAEPPRGNEMEGKPGARNHPGLDTPPRADPAHGPAFLAQPVGHREGGEHVPSGSAGEDAHPGPGHRASPPPRASRSIRTRSPRATQLATRLFPP